MTKDKLVEKIRELLKTDIDLNFLLELKKEEPEKLVACIRDRVDRIIRIETIPFYRFFAKILRSQTGKRTESDTDRKTLKRLRLT